MTETSIHKVVTPRDVPWLAQILREDSEIIYNLERITHALGFPFKDTHGMRMTSLTDKSGSYGFLTQMLDIWIATNHNPKIDDLVKVLRENEFNYTAEKICRHFQPQIWFDVPENTNCFTGRAKEIQLIHEELIQQKSDDSISVISGLGGIGKTALAIQYAWTFKSSSFYSNVLWINSETKATISYSFSQLAKLLRQDESTSIEKGGMDDEETVRTIYTNLGPNQSTLLVFDNIDNYSDIVEYLPNRSPRRAFPYILLTSRNRKWNDRTHVMDLNVFADQDSMELLSKYLNLKTEEEIDTAMRLARILQNLPLAIIQAAAFIKRRRINFNRTNFEEIQSYISEFETNAEHVLDFQYWKYTSDMYRRTTFNTWNITLWKMRNMNPLAWYIMQLMSYMSGENIPTELFMFIRHQDYLKGFHHFVKRIKDPNEKVNNLVIVEALQLLSNHCMIIINSHRSMVSVHRLVQMVIREQCEKKSSAILKGGVKLFQICLQSNEMKYELELNHQANILAEYIKANKPDRKYSRFLELVKAHEIKRPEQALKNLTHLSL